MPSARRPFLLGTLRLLLQARPHLLVIMSWDCMGFLGVPLPGPGSGHPSLQEQGWRSAWDLGPAGGRPAAAGHWLLPGREAAPQQRWLSRNLGLWGPSTQRALPQARCVPPRRHHQPCRSVLEAARGREAAGVTGPSTPHDSPFLATATCSQLGRELLVAGGNVVDAGVGAALCLAVVHPHATGLGQ